MATKNRNYFYCLDIIRFAAAVFVLAFHFGYLTQAADFSAIWPITWPGWVGVEIFFVISGFVIANSAKDASPKQFLKGRALRLYPAAWCCATLTLIVRLGDERLGDLFPSYLRSIALMPKGPWIDVVYWTLAVEIGFYVLIFGVLCAGAFLLLSRVALALTVFSSLCICLLATRSWYPYAAEIVGHTTDLLGRHGCFFAMGAWLWISTTRPLKTWECVGFTVAAAAGVGEIILHGIEYLPAQVGTSSWLFAPVILWGATVALIYTYSRPGEQPHLSPDIEAILRTIGLMTYPLYLVHYAVGTTVMRAMMEIGGNKWIALMAAAAAVMLISWVICRLEPRIRKLCY